MVGVCIPFGKFVSSIYGKPSKANHVPPSTRMTCTRQRDRRAYNRFNSTRTESHLKPGAVLNVLVNVRDGVLLQPEVLQVGERRDRGRHCCQSVACQVQPGSSTETHRPTQDRPTQRGHKKPAFVGHIIIDKSVRNEQLHNYTPGCTSSGHKQHQ